MSQSTRWSAMVIALWSASTAFATDWPMFRGPLGNGTTTATNVPLEWTPSTGIRWKVPLPKPGNGSAIVVGERVFVTSAEDDRGQERSLYCFNKLDGSLRWKKTVKVDKELPTHKTNPYAGTTPASDGKNVYVWHATGGLHAYDLEGNSLWSRDLGEFRHIWGYGTSPIVYEDRVILHSGPGVKVFVAAFDVRDGSTVWDFSDPVEGDGSYNQEKKYVGSWSTPLLYQEQGRTLAILPLPRRIVALNCADGKLVWECDGMRHGGGDLAYSSPLIVKNVCFVTGGFSGPAMGVRLGGTGNVTETHRLWRSEKNPQSIGSGIAWEDVVFRPNAGPGTIECMDPATGKVLWGARALGEMWSSMIMAEGRIYATAQNGRTLVMKPNRQKLETLAENDLNEGTNATFAVSDGTLILRTHQSLTCIGKK